MGHVHPQHADYKAIRRTASECVGDVDRRVPEVGDLRLLRRARRAGGADELHFGQRGAAL